ncbi:hypothetical protein LNP25_28210 [Klebsiella variicola subsp. variicola]|nr:hypothetical protein [Klebsiella variicola subsp. variicola]
MAACRPAFASYPPEDALDHQPATADGAALIYPVITLLPPWSHTATHRPLVGPQASEAADRAWSVQLGDNGHRPCFLVQAQDDPISNPHNTLLMADACRQHQVPSSFRHPRSMAWYGAPGNADDRLAHGPCRLAGRRWRPRWRKIVRCLTTVQPQPGAGGCSGDFCTIRRRVRTDLYNAMAVDDLA